MPPDVAKFLKVVDVEQLTKILFGQTYSRFRKLIYPSPQYESFHITKKNGDLRPIYAPKKLLLQVQKRLVSLIEPVIATKHSVHGFVKGRSIVTNARMHAGGMKRFVFNIDLKDFFPSISFARVKGAFQAEPFKFPHSVAAVLAQICCYQQRLPAGAPTSPLIANLICRKLDGQLEVLAKECRATYTRYCDDITFSFTIKKKADLPEPIVRVHGDVYSVGEKLNEIIKSNGFEINDRKVRLYDKNARMEVTGLTVNEFPNVRRRFIHEIKGALHACETHGIDKADAVFAGKYKRQLRSSERPHILNFLRGKLLFLKMVRGENNRLYTVLARRFNKLLKSPYKKNVKIYGALKVHGLATSKEELEKAIYQIVCEANEAFSEGTGFLLHGVGIVTCEHVIRVPNTTDKYFSKITLNDKAGNVIGHLESKFIHQAADIAVLQPIDFDISSLLSLAVSPRSVRKWDKVFLCGFPNHSPGKDLSVVDATCINLYPKFGHQNFEINELIRVGNSGGPVIDQQFNVLGVAKEGAKQEGGNNAVLDVYELLKLMKKMNEAEK